MGVLGLGIVPHISIRSPAAFHSAWGHAAVDSLGDYSVEPQLETRQMVQRYTNRAGQARVCGGRDLKASQAYPRQLLDSI